MRKLSYLVHTSLDGHIAGPDGEFDWPVLGPELSAYSHALNEHVDTFLYGRVVWDMMSGFWPRAESMSDHPHDLYFAPIWRATPKIVFSRTLKSADWNTRIIGDNLAGEVAALKREPGKDLLLTGGVELAAALTELGLIDEYHVIVHPVVLGGGKRLFGEPKDRLNLELVETRMFDNQTVLLRYRPAVPSPKTLTVPGATIHYEVRGQGPVLLLICGGVYDADGFSALASQLASSYTVVTYDRRGNSRSPLDGPPGEQSIGEHADDAHLLLQAMTSEPAYVFGNSSGAMIGLELAIRHPEQVRTLVAHEPPIFELLSDRDEWRAVTDDVAKTYAAQGAGPAGSLLTAAFVAAGDKPHEPDPAHMPPPEVMERMGRNMEFFIGHEVAMVGRYSPRLDELKTRVVAAVGEESASTLPYHRAAAIIAAHVGGSPVEFPGDHGGFGSRAAEFAARLHSVYSE